MRPYPPNTLAGLKLGAIAFSAIAGEGRVTRDLKARGHRMVAVDNSPTLLRYAREADRESRYELADAVALPFANGSFDLVVAYNSLMDVSDMPAAVRVLEPGGQFAICVTHPLNDAGSFESDGPNAAFVIRETYFGRRAFEGHFERNGLQITFHGWMYPLEDYCRALHDGGLLITRLREPVPSEQTIRKDPSLTRRRRIPMFLQIAARKL